MLIRNMKKSDYAEVDRLLLQIHQMDVSNRPDMFSPANQYMTQECYENLVDSPTVISILAQKHRDILGCCFVSLLGKEGLDESKTAYIDLLVVDEPHRRKGIGKALFQEVQKRAKKMGAHRVDLTVWNYNKDAVCAYESYGMTPLRSVYEVMI